MSNQGNVKLLKKEEKLVFINECLPQLAAGEYTVEADLVVNNKNDFNKAQKNFHVDAPRFILSQSDIYSIYPPRNATGRFETTLPHIVFNRRTLPWERTIDGATTEDTKFRDGQGHAPWMGLLVLNEDEMSGGSIPANKITIDNKSLEDIFIKKPADVFVPEMSNVKGSQPALSAWENKDTVCEVIDVPLEVFKTIMPHKDDLPFLGHVRKVTVDANKESADIDDGGFFSTIVCNRLPSRSTDLSLSKRNTAFLVSLEGFHKYFIDQAHIKQNKVRLVVLTSWSFTVAPGKNFRELCDGLKVGPLKMNTPEASADLKVAYDYGYTLLPHFTRNGAKTFSWYRGPFNPNFLPANPETIVFDSTDEALRFDRQTGIFDVSYAAAWQLGRMLALKDKVFSNALYQWKMQDKRNAVKKQSIAAVASLFPAGFRPATDTDAMPLEEMVKGFLEKRYKSLAEAPAMAADISLTTSGISEQNDLDNKPPKEVTDWLGKLFLLHGVPLNYMVPHEHYLGSGTKNNFVKETLGTFFIDYSWVEALLGGALGIVSNKDSEALLKMLKDGRFLPANLLKNQDIIKEIPDESEPMPLPHDISGHITGFFLRSELVSGWKGVKIYPKDATGWMEAPLRIENVADDIKLCIFSGRVREIFIIQPPEGIHFGIEGNSNEKKLRNPDGVVGNESVALAFHNREHGVINMARTAAEMKQIKKRSDGTDAPYSSADLAFQMLEGPIMFTLTINDIT